MAFFSDLWEGVKNVAGGIAKMLGTIMEALFEGIFWLIDKIFDAIDAFSDFIEETIDWIIEGVGSFFTSKEKGGESGILPPTPEVITIIEGYDKVMGTDHVRKAKEGKASLGYVQNGNGTIEGVRIIGSEKGFGTEISAAHKRRKIFARKIKNE